MRKRWTVLAVLAGVVAFNTVLLWPSRPIWHVPLASLGLDNRFIRPSTWLAPDGHTITVVATSAANDGDLAIINLDPASGQLQQPAVRLAGAANNRFVSVVPDGRFIACVSRGAFEANLVRYDAITGALMTEIIPLKPRHDLQDSIAFSPDGQSFAITQPHSRTQRLVFRTATAALLFAVSLDGNDQSAVAAFRPDSRAVAFVECDSTGDRLVIHAVPSGERLRVVPLPGRPSRELVGWFDAGLVATRRHHAYPDALEPIVHLLIDPVAEQITERERIIEARPSVSQWFTTPNDALVLLREPVLPDWQSRWRDWIKERTGWQWPMAVREASVLEPANGDNRGRLPGSVSDEASIIGFNRKRVLTVTKHRDLELWEFEASRWPWALLACVGAMSPVLFLGRRRAKR